MPNDSKRDASDLFRYAPTRLLFKNPRFLLGLRTLVALLFFYAIYYGFAHPGKENLFTGALFWGIFWALFMVATLPTFGRIFCGVCPHGFLGKYITAIGLKKTMPSWLTNRYVGIMLLVFGWWGVSYSVSGFWRSPLTTTALFGGMTLIAFVLYYLYKDMSYCKSVCPIGMLTRAYDKLSFTKLETYTDGCQECRSFDCANACHYNLKPFTFAKKNSMDDCTLCMDCAVACEDVKFSLTRPAGKLHGRFKALVSEVWVYLLIIGSIPVSMSFAHGLNRTALAPSLPWNLTAELIGAPQLGGMFAFLYALFITLFMGIAGLWLASKALKVPYKSAFTTLGYAYAPLFVLASLGHTLEHFFVSGYTNVVAGFSQAFGEMASVSALAQRHDSWLILFDAFKWVGVVWALYLLYLRMQQLSGTKTAKSLAYLAASLLIGFYIALNLFRGYAMQHHAAKHGSHAHGMHTPSAKTVQRQH